MTGKELLKKTEEIFNKRDKEAFLKLHHRDVELTTPSGQVFKGPEAATAYGWALIEAFPDARISTKNVVSEGDLTYAEQQLEGTNTAPLKDPSGKMPTIPATGKHVVITGVGMLRVQDGLVREVHFYMDNMAFMAQLGLLPTPATA